MRERRPLFAHRLRKDSFCLEAGNSKEAPFFLLGISLFCLGFFFFLCLFFCVFLCVVSFFFFCFFFFFFFFFFYFFVFFVFFFFFFFFFFFVFFFFVVGESIFLFYDCTFFAWRVPRR